MDETKDRDVPVGSVSESTVTESEQVAGETLVGSGDGTVQGQIEGSFNEGLEGESCHGDDIMVEVLGSDVYVGGVCTSGSGENLDGENGDGAPMDVEVVSERPVNPVDGGGAAVNGSDSRDAGVSGGEALNQGTQNGGCLGVSEPVPEKARVVDGGVTRGVSSEEEVAEGTGRGSQIVSGGDEAPNVGNCAVEGSTDGETEVNHVADVAMVPREEGVKGVIHEVGANTGREVVSGGSEANEDVNKPEVEVSGRKNEVESPVGSRGEKSKDVEADRKLVGGGDDVRDGVVGEVDKGVILSSKVEVQETDDIGEDLSSVEKEQVKIEIGGGSIENHSNVNADSKSSHQQTQVVVESAVSVTESKIVSVSQQDGSLNPEEYLDNNMACDIRVESNMEQAMEIDGQVRDADGGHEKVSNTEVPVPAEKSEENLEKTVTCDVSPVCANKVQDIEVEENITEAQQHGLHGGQQIEFEKQQEMSEEMGGVIENEGHIWVDVTSSCPPTQGHAEGTTPSNSVPNSVDKSQTEATDNVDISPVDTEEVLISATEVPRHSDNNQKLASEDCLPEDVTTDAGVKEQVTAVDDFGLRGEQDLAVVKEVTDSEQPNDSEEKIAKWESLEPESSSTVNIPTYELPPEDEGIFSVHDLVWGKVKSHPWWPGQIFDFTDASEKAMKHHKKDCFLVAYFGDRTFAWNEASSLKSFRTHFSQMEKHCNADTFQHAVNCTLEEVSRRVELGLACSCIPKDSRDNIQFQIVENAGIRPESSRRDGVDESASASSFQVDKLLEYIKALARFSSEGCDRLELEIAKAQLLALSRFKGFCGLPEYQCCGGLVEDNTVGSRFRDSIHPREVIEDASTLSKDDERTSSSQEISKLHSSSSHKRKHNLRDGVHPKLKEKSLSELMVGAIDSLDDDNWSGKRRKGADYHTEDLTTQDGRRAVTVAKVSNSPNFPKQSFKIGECIRRVASQLTGSPTVKIERVTGSPTMKIERVKIEGSSDKPGDGYDISFQTSEDTQKGRVVDPAEYSSLDELLMQLLNVAQDPVKEYNFSNVITNFFSDFRNSVTVGQYSGTELVSMEKVSDKRKKRSPETFEFDDMNDTYWTDRVIQNGSEEQPPRRGRKKDNQQEKPHQETRKPYSRKRYSTGDHVVLTTPEKPAGYVSENAPAELTMNFSEVKSMPSEANLNKMFRRFGPLKEMETEVDRESSRARVVFKKTSDAEVACSSAEKFNIFGPTLVNYQLSYTPTLPFKASPVVSTQDHEMQLDLSAHDHEMQLDLSTHEHEMQLDLSTHDHEMQLDLSSLSSFEVNLV